MNNPFHIRRLFTKKEQGVPPSNSTPSSHSAASITASRSDDKIHISNPAAVDETTHKALQTEDALLFEAHSVWPLDFFPDKLIIKEKSISVIRKYMLSSYTETMMIRDIGLVSIHDGIIFSSLVISYKAPMEDVAIAKLWPEKAHQAKSIIEKLVVQGGGEPYAGNKDESYLYTTSKAKQ